MISIEQEIKSIFDSICWKLNRGAVCNYQASLGLFHASAEDTRNLSEGALVLAILGSDTVANFFRSCTIEEMLLEISECIGWKGDDTSFPNRKYHMKEAYLQDIAKAFSAIRSLLNSGSEISTFVIEKGHPFYPVYWEFAYLIRAAHASYVLVGSCSD